MPRPKGSKNKNAGQPKNESARNIGEKLRKLENERDAIAEKIAALTASVEAQKKELTAAKREQRRLVAGIAALNGKQKQMAEREAAREKQEEAQKLVVDFLAGGKTVDDLVSLLKTE